MLYQSFTYQVAVYANECIRFNFRVCLRPSGSSTSPSDASVLVRLFGSAASSSVARVLVRPLGSAVSSSVARGLVRPFGSAVPSSLRAVVSADTRTLVIFIPAKQPT